MGTRHDPGMALIQDESRRPVVDGECTTLTHMSETVGLRALQQNASAVVARVVAGEEVVITDRGRPVARIVPLEPRRRGLQELIDEGLLTPATRSISDLPPPMVLSGGPTASEILAEMREADRER